MIDYLSVRPYGRPMTDAPPPGEQGVDGEPFDDTPIPTLMRGARGAYAQAIRAELEAIGVDDLPRNGAFVLFGTLAAGSGPEERGPAISAQLGISKQAVSQLVETLVGRGYLLRSGDPEDGRRVALEVKRRAARFEPIFPVRELTAALGHYERLGFKTHSFDEGYGFANWGGVSIHLAVHPDHQTEGNVTAAYLRVSDVDAVHAAWSRPGVGGVTRAVSDTPWGMREGSHTDPDGNLIRFGSPLKS
jgi:catechol 2,3-dioxygenase-like lactoylglutathione lyase family enzyme